MAVIAIKEEQMKIKYIVEVGWKDSYTFDNADAAMAFAIIAVTHSEETAEVKVIVRVVE